MEKAIKKSSLSISENGLEKKIFRQKTGSAEDL